MPAAPTHQYIRIATNTLPFAVDAAVFTPAYGSGKWVLTNGTQLATSTDNAVTWNVLVTLAAGNEFLTGVYWNNFYFHVVSRNTTTNVRTMHYSADGATWLTSTIGTMTNASTWMIANPAGVVIVYNSNSTSAFRSTDHGATWSAMTLFAAGAIYTPGIWNGTVFAYSRETGGSGTVLRSTTGATGSWSSTAFSPVQSQAGRMFTVGSDIYWSARLGGPLQKSTDNAASFSSFPASSGSNVFQSVGVDGRWVRASTSSPHGVSYVQMDSDAAFDAVLSIYGENGEAVGPFGVKPSTGDLLVIVDDGSANSLAHRVDWDPIPTIQIYAGGGEPTYLPAFGNFILELETANALSVTIAGTNDATNPDASWNEAYVSRLPFDEVDDIWELPDYLYFDKFTPDSIIVSGDLGDTTYVYVAVAEGETYELVITINPIPPFWTAHVNSEEV